MEWKENMDQFQKRNSLEFKETDGYDLNLFYFLFSYPNSTHYK